MRALRDRSIVKRLVSTIFAAAAFVLVRRRHLLVARADPQLRSPRLYLPLELTSQGRLDIARRLFARTAPTAPPVPAREEFITSTLDEHPIRAVVYDTHERPPNSGALLWIHGGGMVMGAPEIDHQLCSRFAGECGVLVVSVDYRLAPEHPFPTPLVDCHDVLRWLHDHADRLGVDASRIAVGGASAGGGLAASLCQFARDRGGPAIAFQLLQYPMLDDRTALRRDAQALVWSNRSNEFGWSCYLGHPLADGEQRPHAVPARTEDLSALPPAWIGVGDIDLFHDEDVEYARRLTAAGVQCELHVVPGMYHAAEQFAPGAPSMQDFVGRMVDAVRAAVGAPDGRAVER